MLRHINTKLIANLKTVNFTQRPIAKSLAGKIPCPAGAIESMDSIALLSVAKFALISEDLNTEPSENALKVPFIAKGCSIL